MRKWTPKQMPKNVRSEFMKLGTCVRGQYYERSNNLLVENIDIVSSGREILRLSNHLAPLISRIGHYYVTNRVVPLVNR